ncbi:MAG TPA: type II secretion system secretin GspD [Xanthobacteraceae bacterium]|nr:type II secretion system secretin GspD [Xanthobacteraceae bacterium]
MNAAQRGLWQRMAQFGAAIPLMCSLLGCAMTEQIPGQLAGSTPKPDGVMDPVLNANLHATVPTAVPSQTGAAGQSTRPLLFPGADTEPAPHGTGIEASGPPNGTLVTGAEGVDINFENADIATVARTLLSDTLGLSFVVDPRVQGSITLASNGPIARKDVLPVFESVLRMSNAALVRDGNLIKILPVPEATGTGPVTLGGGEPGFGVSIVPLRYTSAPTIAKAVENFVTRPGAVRVDQARNLLLIQGTTSERRDALVVIATFDVEWLHNQSVGIYPLKSTTPETMIRELEKVFDAGDGGQGQGVVRFQPVARMNAVMVVTRNEKMLERATQWVGRLDHSDTSGTTVRIYQLSFGNATKIAKILNDIFVGKSGTGAETAPANQLAPGTNATASRLDALSVGGGGGAAGSPSSASTGGSTTGQMGGSDSNSRASIQTAFGSFADRWNQDESGGGGPSGAVPRGVFQNVRITANTSDNSIVIYSNQEDYRVIEHALQQLDRPQLQVAIDAMVAEVTLNDQLQYGVQYFLTSSAVGLGSNQGSAGLFNAATSAAQTALLARVLPGFNLLLGSEANPRLIISALDSVSKTKVLSAPSLVVTDNQPAILEVGQDVPISTGSATVLTTSNTVVNTIDMRSTGIILKVLPHVHPNGSIELELEQEVSAVVPTATQTLTPTITERRVHSTVRMTSGQTVLLGGLISEQDQATTAGMPVIDQIKYLGDLLSNKTDIRNRTEIIIFIKAQLIRNGFDAQKVSEEFRERLQSMQTPRAVVSGTGVEPPPVIKK